MVAPAGTQASGTRSASRGPSITGYSRHGLDRALSRGGHGVAPWAILDAVKNPLEVVKQPGGTFRYTGRAAVVVLNEDGKLVSTWALGRKGRRY